MIITLSSAQSQGKTTLLNRLSMDQFLVERNFQFQTSTIRDIKKNFGIDINELGGDLTQGLVIAKHIESAHRKGNWILDRCILDSAAYAIASKNLSQHAVEFNISVLKQLIKQYGAMFYIIPELPIVAEEGRSTDKEYFDKVLYGFNYLIHEYKLPIIELSGSIETRYNTVINHVKSIYN